MFCAILVWSVSLIIGVSSDYEELYYPLSCVSLQPGSTNILQSAA